MQILKARKFVQFRWIPSTSSNDERRLLTALQDYEALIIFIGGTGDPQTYQCHIARYDDYIVRTMVDGRSFDSLPHAISWCEMKLAALVLSY